MKDNNFYIYLHKQIPVMMVLSLLPGLGYIFLGWLNGVYQGALIWYVFIVLTSLWGYSLYREFDIDKMTELHIHNWYRRTSIFFYNFFLLWCVIFLIYIAYDEYSLHYIAIFTQVGASVVAAAILYPSRILYRASIYTLMVPLMVYFLFIGTWYGYVLVLFSITLTWVLLYSARGTFELLSKTSYQANHDWLTGLYNRQFFVDHLQKKMNTLSVAQQYSFLLLIDLDHFKTVNDSLGHDVGDRLLKEVGSRLRNAISTDCIVARLGGDEFMVAGRYFNGREDCKNTALELAEKLLVTLKEGYQIERHYIYISCSIGASLIQPASQGALGFIKEADIAMYEVKEKGRDGVFFFDDEMSQRVEYNLRVESLLHNAIAQGEIYLNFQPQYDLQRRIVGVEILARWQSRELGVVSPACFIAIAEQTGLIIELGHSILEQAFACFAQWREQGIVLQHYSINISMRQMLHKKFITDVQTLSNRYLGADLSNRIIFELTESVVAEDIHQVVRIMDAVSKFGIRFSMDDFGTGYSSLSYIKQLPVSELKIDRSFIKDIGEDPSAQQMIETILNLARIFQLRVVAEGIETELQLEFVRNHNCDLVQGYYLSHPLDEIAFLELYRNTNTRQT